MTAGEADSSDEPADDSGDAVLPGMPEPLYVASPSRLAAWLDCPRRYRMQYLDRPRPPARPARAHTHIGTAVHAALAAWWHLPRRDRSARAGARLVERGWIDVGFRDPAQSMHWRTRSATAVSAYLETIDPDVEPPGVERVVPLRAFGMSIAGKIDRLDLRGDVPGGRFVVVDYKTGRVVPTPEEARTSLALALYAGAVWQTFRRRCVDVELHHVPSGTIVAHRHTPDGLRRKVDEAASIVADLRRADANHRRGAGSGAEKDGNSGDFAPRPSALCRWCDFRAHCVEGQQMGPEKSSWAALEERGEDRSWDES